MTFPYCLQFWGSDASKTITATSSTKFLQVDLFCDMLRGPLMAISDECLLFPPHNSGLLHMPKTFCPNLLLPFHLIGIPQALGHSTIDVTPDSIACSLSTDNCIAKGRDLIWTREI